MRSGISLAIARLIGLFMLVLSLVAIASAQWKEQVLYSFQGGSDGQTPAGGVAFDKQGNLYGATETGTVFQLVPPAKKGDPWTETVLYTFKGKNDNNDGMNPWGGLVTDRSGNLYGTTAYGGTGGCILLGILYGCGTVYELSPPQQKGGQWAETILYSFQSANDGYYPWGNLTFDKAGNLYGATQFGGGKGNSCDVYYGGNCGTVFKLSPPKQKGGAWTEKVLHSFAGVANGQQSGDGGNPNGGLVLDSRGMIYGTTYIGGYNCPHNSNQGCGTVFKLTPPNKNGAEWTEIILHRFKDAPDGAIPAAGLALREAGVLYGTTKSGGGGNYPSGTVFRLSRRASGSWAEQVLYTFQDGSDGAQPLANVTFNKKGNLYGVASGGGESQRGTVFSMKPPIHKSGDWGLSVLYDFTGSPDGAGPSAGLTFDNNGNLCSTTVAGGTGNCRYGGCGTVFGLSP